MSLMLPQAKSEDDYSSIMQNKRYLLFLGNLEFKDVGPKCRISLYSLSVQWPELLLTGNSCGEHISIVLQQLMVT